MKLFSIVCLFVLTGFSATYLLSDEPLHFSGIYPHLAMFNDEGECGTGAVVPWADRLWIVTYAPHKPSGSSDKLYEIHEDLTQIVRPESIGGTPANRMIHPESQQLFIGPYAIDAKGKVRPIPYDKMFGRPTGNARHLLDPGGKIYYATMEEGLYEVDVKSLSVTELWADEQSKSGRHANLPGYHGKGLYSAQGRIIYANNGEHGEEAQKRPDVASGVLAEWNGEADQWTVVRRNQFTEVTGPGGIFGSKDANDPVWTIGWDHRSLILMTLHNGTWYTYRLPKASHSYDGAHGWNTEWPRIRDIGEEHLLMTMHGMFWKFPKGFTPNMSSGIAPRSTYLKVIGDFCLWNDRIVFGCDDTAKNEFLNKRKAKGTIAAPQSQSNLWFVDPKQLDDLGPVIGRGGVWVNEDVVAGTPSEPYLLTGFERKAFCFSHRSNHSCKLTIEVDEGGTGNWQTRSTNEVPASSDTWRDMTNDAPATWIRISSDRALKGATAWFVYSNADSRPIEADPIFSGVADIRNERVIGGTIRTQGENERTLRFVAQSSNSDGVKEQGLYTLDARLKLTPTGDAKALAFEKKSAAIPVGVLSADRASVIFVDDNGKRWRLPRGSSAYDDSDSLEPMRVCREVATERDLFNAYGTFFELPAENAGGFAKARAVATHNRRISDYCSYRGLFVMSGIASEAPNENPHIIRSDDSKAALWVGAIDNIWKMGKPRGVGGPWKETEVEAGKPSDPYLATGYDGKRLTLSHNAEEPVAFRIEYDPTGTGIWFHYQSLDVAPQKVTDLVFPAAFSAAWLRVVASTNCTATAEFSYD